MDGQAVLTQLDADTGDVSGSLTLRYDTPAQADCTTFVSDLTAVYDNYYSVKETDYPPIRTRADTTDAAIATYQSDITTIASSFTGAMTSLEAVIDGVVDPDYGMINGFNCAIFGEDINLLLSTFCSHLYTTTYFLRLGLGIAGIGIVFAMCCGVCTGVRVHKHELISSKQIDDPNLHNENTME